MNIGLIDVDSKWKTHGNLALMKIYNYHKNQGDHIEWAHPLYIKQFDKIYASSLFTTSNKEDIPVYAVKGGPGFIDDNTFNITLPREIETCDPDYSLYPHLDFSYQRYSFGCQNGCRFCVVPELEGHVTVPVKPMELNPKGKYIYLLDSNFFASDRWRWAINHLRENNQPIHWEGIDVRILSHEMVEAIFSMKLKGRIHIAWDNPHQAIDSRIAILFPQNIRRHVMCYVLIGFDSKPEEDLYRVETLRKLGVDPFVMPYDRSNMYQRNFARWCNHKPIWKKIPWKDYRWKNKKSLSVASVPSVAKKEN